MPCRLEEKNKTFLTGRTNYRKTYLLKDLVMLLNAFNSPATLTFAWAGAEKAEAVFLTVS